MIEFDATTDDGQMYFRAVVNAVLRHLPDGCEIDLTMRNGTASVGLLDQYGSSIPFADDTKTLEQNINDALCVANGWVLNAETQRRP
jgi:hypothetical protein